MTWRYMRGSMLLIIAAVIPVVALSGGFGYYLTATQRHSLDEGIRSMAARLSLAVSRELASQVQLLTILSESPRLDPPLQVAEFAKLGERLRQRVPAWEMLRITALDGSVRLTVPPGEEPRRGSRVVDVESHMAMIKSAEPAVGHLTLGPRGLPAFPVRVPVIRDGRVVYGLTSVIRPEALGEIIAANGLASDWIGWIEDGNRRLVFATFGTVSALTRPIEESVQVESMADALAVGNLSDGRSVRIDSVRVAGTDWKMYVGMPSEAYVAAYRRGLAVLAITALVTIGLATLAAILFLRELGARRREDDAVASWQRLDALGKLAGGVAHDLNNLLMVFQSAVESVRRRPDDKARLFLLLDSMGEAVTRGKTLSQRLLSFTRRANSDAVTVSLGQHVGGLRDVLSHAGQGLVTITVDFGPDVWPVKIDLQSFETALINLVTNAREAMPHGGGVRVACRNVEDLSSVNRALRGPGVAVSVSDEGPGIPAEDLNRILEPFYSTKDGASGLGLSQVAAFAKRSGGSLTINSVPSRGSVFAILLPLDRPAEGEARDFSDVHQLPSSVLVVDDSALSLEAARRALEDAGVGTLIAPDGRTALKLLETQAVGGVLTDIRMPSMSGLELLDRVRAIHPRLPIVLMTGYSEVIEEGIDVDAPVLTKPFTAEQLRRAFSDAQSPWTTASKIVSLKRV